MFFGNQIEKRGLYGEEEEEIGKRNFQLTFFKNRLLFKMLGIIIGIFLFNFRLELVSKERLEREPFFSSSGKSFFYYLEYGSEGIGETPISKFSLYDKEKRLLLEISSPNEEAFFVSDAGWFVGVLGSHPKAQLTFYDLKGNRRKRVEVDYPQGYSFSPSGKFFYANTGKGILAFSENGKVVQNFGFGGPFFPSSDDKFFVVRKEDSLKIFKDGKPLKSLPLTSLLFRHLSFSPNNFFLVVGEKHNLSLYSLKETKSLWQKEFPPSISILKVAVDDKGFVFVGGEETKDKRRGFLLILKDGKELERVEIPYDEDYETINAVSLDRSNLFVRTTDSEIRFKIAEED